MELIIAVIVWVCLAILVGKFWKSRGHSSGKGIAFSIVLSPLVGFLIGAVLQTNEQVKERMKIESGGMKKCPSCAELVKREAIKCRFCGYEFSEESIVGNERVKDEEDRAKTVMEEMQRQMDIINSGVCPACKESIDKNYTKCFGCGFEFPT